MVLGPDNAIWFTDGGLNEIGRIDQNGNVSHFPLTRLPHLQPQGITVGADGNLWFTELLGNRIGRIIPSTGNITEFMVPTTNAQPNGIIGCQNGNPCPTTRAVFFTEIQKVGKVKGF
jgi:virginiamycin B lyase